MTVPASPSSLFGIPLAVRRAEATRLLEALTDLWTRQAGRRPGSLEDDLDAMRSLFDPLATGQRLRKALSELPPLPAVKSRYLTPPLVLTHGHEMLVTLEGRAVIEAFKDLLETTTDSVLVIGPDLAFALVHSVYRRYREWSIRRLDDVVDLMSGKGRQSLSAPGIAFLLLLLVNGSHSPSTALTRPARREDQDRVNAAVGAAISAFSDALNQGERDERHFSLYSSWAVSEARRRLPGALAPGTDLFYITPGSEERVLSLIASEFQREKRSPSTQAVLAAFDALVSAYRNTLPTLASMGMAHERRATTRRLRDRLEAAIASHD